MLKIEITVTETFEDSPHELERVLAQALAKVMSPDRTEGALLGMNGNTVGHWKARRSFNGG